jgi:ABC-2 type transport system ATP-binding protein
MRLIAGYLSPSAGRVSVCGHDMATDPLSAKRLLGYMPEGAPAYPDMTPLGFLKFIASARGIKEPEKTQRIERAIDLVHLQPVLEQPIETLSKGFQRRLGLAQAILHGPWALILDEPTDGLDPNQKHEVRNLIRAMAPETAIVVSTHILEEVEAICTRAIIINEGRIIAHGRPEGDGWRLGEVFAPPGRLDGAFRQITQGIPQ